MSKLRTFILLAAALVVAGLMYRYSISKESALGQQTTELRSTPQATITKEPIATNLSGASKGDAIATPVAPLPISVPTSLADTEIDGAVELDAAGQLRPTASLRRLFDQVLSSVGELNIDQIRALLAARLDQITTPDGKRLALAAFERYLRYLQTVDQSAARLSGLPLNERLAALVELRRQQLGPEMADAFFADEEAYQNFTLQRRALAEDTALSADERAARERELIAELPESAREPYLAQLRTEADLTDGAAIETLSGDAAERYRLRSERFGTEAAARLELLDRERAAWDQRLLAYRNERTRLQARDAASGEAALNEYRLRHFSEAEQRRIHSLEEIGKL